MKTVVLLRHAKSDWGDTGLRDFDRPLNGRGERAATLMGSWARREQLAVTLILASPAARVRGTLGRFCESHGHCPEPSWDQRIYLASAETLAEVIAEADNAHGALLLAGHNPGLEEFILDHVRNDGASALREDVAEKFPTAAIAVLEFDIDHWDALAQGEMSARLRRFIRPRDLDPALGPDGS